MMLGSHMLRMKLRARESMCLTGKADRVHQNIIDVVQRKGLHRRVRALPADNVHTQLHDDHADSAT